MTAPAIPFKKATKNNFALAQRKISSFNLSPKKYFEHFHLSSPDPWDFKNRVKEQKRHQNTLSAMPDLKNANALEVGCSSGFFTRLLARKVSRLHALDISEIAISHARQKCRGIKNTRFFAADILKFKNPRKYDLIFCAEMLYYLPAASIYKMRKKLSSLLSSGGYLITVQPQNSPWEDFLTKKGWFHLIKTEFYKTKPPHRPYRISIFSKAPKKRKAAAV